MVRLLKISNMDFAVKKHHNTQYKILLLHRNKLLY